MQRESFKSRIGFILLSAGCAIGIGNIWKFPYMTGNNGGGVFVLFYLIFLVVIGIPILTMEFAIGRASRQSTARAYEALERPGQKWHIHGKFAIVGNYILMIFYTVVSGWMVYYFFHYLTGDFSNLKKEEISEAFDTMLGKPGTMTFWMGVIVVLGFGICSLGLQKGVERITKWMMLALLTMIIVLAIHSLTLENGMEGLKFYLYPDFNSVRDIGLIHIIVAAMNQSFFTLSLGIGAMLIFGSYMDKSHSLLGESITIAALDTFVAIVAGLIIFPACFSFGINPDSGPNLIFITLPHVLNSMPGGRIWAVLFFLFMTFASLSTIIAVFENILSCCMEQWNLTRKKAAVINVAVIFVLSLPCVFGYNIWSGFKPFGDSSTVLDLEDFIVSNLFLPIGSLSYLMFCVSRLGWGFDNYLAEANTGTGPKISKKLRIYLTYILPLIVIFLFVQGLVVFFK